MASDSSLENKCENLMNIVVESRKRFGKMCLDYEQKTSLMENKMLNLKIETFSCHKFKSKNPTQTAEEDAKEIEKFSQELIEMSKKLDAIQRKIKNTQDVVMQIKADSVGKRLREPLSADIILAKVKDVITSAPSELLDVMYSSGIRVDVGKELTPTQVKDKPVVKWTPKDNEYYTLAMVDPDAPSRENPKFREWHHWLVGNIFGGDMNKGEILSDYIGSGPPKGTGLHRYVFLLYKQPDKCDFAKIPKLPSNSGDKRGKFSIAKFSQQYKLGTPIAGNFYVAKYDDYVPKLYAKLKG